MYEQKLRKQLKQGSKCEVCGSIQNLQIHHYKPKSQGGKDEESNYIVVCSTCHKTFHGNNNKVQL
jgi:5-methylcytosine-specific restriction endonuclease McrA